VTRERGSCASPPPPGRAVAIFPGIIRPGAHRIRCAAHRRGWAGGACAPGLIRERTVHP
jgi:hypothetical protein